MTHTTLACMLTAKQYLPRKNKIFKPIIDHSIASLCPMIEITGDTIVSVARYRHRDRYRNRFFNSIPISLGYKFRRAKKIINK